MRSFFFAAKIAFLFVLLLGLSLGGALILFMRVAAPTLAEDIGRLRAFEAANVAEKLESTLAGLAAAEPTELEAGSILDSQVFRAALRKQAERSGLHLTVGEETRPPSPKRLRRYRFHPPSFKVQGRELIQLGPPAFDLWQPLSQGGKMVGFLRVRGPSHAATIHLAFERGLLRIAMLSLLSVVLLSVVLTVPLRRMSGSMDRIAAGELDHRVTVRGRDEVAAMGRSFNAMADRIKEMVRGQQEMLAGVSHELRSPLGRMKMTLELLREHDRMPAARLSALEEEIDHVDALIQEILTASRLDLGTAPLCLESVGLRSSVEVAWSKIEHSQVELINELDSQTTVWADPLLTARILGNLLSNARRYARTRIRVQGVQREKRIQVEIADDGPGVQQEQLSSLFDPFYRADPARSHGNHVGMGLAIVRKAVIAHGGRVEATISDLGGLGVIFDLAADSPASSALPPA